MLFFRVQSQSKLSVLSTLNPKGESTVSSRKQDGKAVISSPNQIKPIVNTGVSSGGSIGKTCVSSGVTGVFSGVSIKAKGKAAASSTMSNKPNVRNVASSGKVYEPMFFEDVTLGPHEES